MMASVIPIPQDSSLGRRERSRKGSTATLRAAGCEAGALAAVVAEGFCEESLRQTTNAPNKTTAATAPKALLFPTPLGRFSSELKAEVRPESDSRFNRFRSARISAAP